jgi:hypothetical protein
VTVNDNKTLAEQARRIAADAPAGSLMRRAGGCVAVAAATTGTVKKARTVLGAVSLDDVRVAALALLDDLTTASVPTDEATRTPTSESQGR